jgi:Protein of unknown function (DUF3365)
MPNWTPKHPRSGWIVALGGVVALTAVAAIRPNGQSAHSQDAKTELATRADKARAVTIAYAERLKHHIVKALKAEGPLGAIAACNTLAPELSEKLTEESSFEVFRTASKVRNPDNAADAWEQEVLDKFAAEIARGVDPSKLEHYEKTITKEGQKFFRYMRPIVTGEVCLTCHGPDVKSDVKAEIAKFYPDDKALGYRIGEMRGAFSLFQQLE